MKGNLAEKSLKTLENKKVSLNFDVDTLRFVDELSEITNTTRITTIMSIIGSGMKSLLVDLENSWEKMKSEKNHNSVRVDRLLKQVNELKKKYNLK